MGRRESQPRGAPALTLSAQAGPGLLLESGFCRDVPFEEGIWWDSKSVKAVVPGEGVESEHDLKTTL